VTEAASSATGVAFWSETREVDHHGRVWKVAAEMTGGGDSVASVDFEQFLKARAQFTTDEWMDVLMQSMGFNPEMFGRRAKILALMRLVPYCERNYNLLELGPKGTGKSHIYAEFSPHGMLISGSEITSPKLFVNNASGKIGLLGYWDCVCFDEFAGKDKKVDKTLVDIMKNYMANRTFSRGIEQLTGQAPSIRALVDEFQKTRWRNLPVRAGGQCADIQNTTVS
jgi:uncharacterized protein (TIGR02688 family)